MTVRAPDFAFLDLGEDRRPGTRGSENRNLEDLLGRIAVVELEHQRIGLMTAHAGMRTQVIAYAGAVPFAPRFDARGLALDVLIAVREVVLPTVGSLTPSAVGLSLTAEEVREREVPHRLPHATARAAPRGEQFDPGRLERRIQGRKLRSRSDPPRWNADEPSAHRDR